MFVLLLAAGMALQAEIVQDGSLEKSKLVKGFPFRPKTPGLEVPRRRSWKKFWGGVKKGWDKLVDGVTAPIRIVEPLVIPTKRVGRNENHRTCTNLPNGEERCYRVTYPFKKYTFKTTKPGLKKVQFTLYNKDTGSCRGCGETGSFENGFGRWRKGKPVKVIVHGFQPPGASGYYQLCYDMVPEMLPTNDWNVICVNWHALAAIQWKSVTTWTDFGFYNLPLHHSMHVGRHIGKFLRYQQKTQREPSSGFFKRVHLIGHSLGAHASGMASKWIYDNTNKRLVGRISALDPAGPGFGILAGDMWGITEYVEKRDASYVDVWHTNGGWSDKGTPTITTFMQGKLGYLQPIGHADFYINGGKAQKGCHGLGLNPDGMIGVMICSHNRAVDLFTEGIKRPFRAQSCTLSSRSVYSKEKGYCLRRDEKYVFKQGVRGRSYYTKGIWLRDAFAGVYHQPRGLFWFNTGSRSPYNLGH